MKWTSVLCLCGRVCHERLRPIKRCYGKDEGRPLEVVFRKEPHVFEVDADKPLISGNAARKSAERRSTNFSREFYPKFLR